MQSELPLSTVLADIHTHTHTELYVLSLSRFQLHSRRSCAAACLVVGSLVAREIECICESECVCVNGDPHAIARSLARAHPKHFRVEAREREREVI